MCKGKYFGVMKPIMNSEILNFKILTPFVTSWIPKMTQNGPKIAKMDQKWPKMAQKLAPAKKKAEIYLQYLQLFPSLTPASSVDKRGRKYVLSDRANLLFTCPMIRRWCWVRVCSIWSWWSIWPQPPVTVGALALVGDIYFTDLCHTFLWYSRFF